MKLKTRLVIAFITVIFLPLIFSGVFIIAFTNYQMGVIEKTYGVKDTSYDSLSNSMQILNKMTEKLYHEIADVAKEDPDCLDDVTYLEKKNQQLLGKNAYLLVRKGNEVIYIGGDVDEVNGVMQQLPGHGEAKTASENGVYLGGDVQALVKQIDFDFSDTTPGSVFIITDVSNMIPEYRQFMMDILVAVVLILVVTAGALIIWIYRGIAIPLGKMQRATNNIKEGNLDFEICAAAEDEIGQLCKDFEEMRKRLKANAEEKLAFDKENKELISNISHDLKTPVTAIKGYAEGIMDGVADTPEKQEKYIRTIYSKANEMDRLINELTLYSKIDTNRIPYNFSTIPVNEYFDDCAEDLSLELEAKNVEFGYFNYVENNDKIIADAEQLKRVINNIVTNSLKYMDKEKAKINLRVKDVGDFIQVELEDNGKGIGAKDLPYIFERFYRTDASRNSSKGGSGIGLSIVKKIIEEHGGKIWATSREGTGTVMYFVVRKYQEVPVKDE